MHWVALTVHFLWEIVSSSCKVVLLKLTGGHTSVWPGSGIQFWECERLCVVFQFVHQAGISQAVCIPILSRSSWQVLVCLGASLAVGKLPNICWLDHHGYQTGSIKDTRLSYGSSPYSSLSTRLASLRLYASWLSRSSRQVLVCLGASLAVGKLPNILLTWSPWLPNRVVSIKDTRLSCGYLPFSRIYCITVYGWPVWSLQNHALLDIDSTVE